MSNHVNWKSRPKISHPVLVAAFEGWNDAGEAASRAIQWIAKEWNAKEFCEIDPEEFYDFTQTRPTIRMEGNHTDPLQWPRNRFLSCRIANRNVVLFDGTEPHLKWRTYCENLIDVASQVGATEVFTLQSSLADVPHTRPSKVMSFTTDPTLAAVMDETTQPTYEGPTGITSAFREQCDAADIDVASLWVSVPHYVGHIHSPKATLALIRSLTTYLRVPVNTESLQDASRAYEAQVSELVENEDEIIEYVRNLEESSDAEDAQTANAESLGEAAEQFLRDKW